MTIETTIEKTIIDFQLSNKFEQYESHMNLI